MGLHDQGSASARGIADRARVAEREADLVAALGNDPHGIKRDIYRLEQRLHALGGIIADGYVDSSGQRWSPQDVKTKQFEVLAEIDRLRALP